MSKRFKASAKPVASSRESSPRWVPLEWGALPGNDPHQTGVPIVGPHGTCWTNDRYVVQSNRFDAGPPFGLVIHLSLSNRDRSARRDWRDFQRIKNQLAGEAWTAVEVYPPESMLVDQANQFHLWCFQYVLPFAWDERRVSIGGIGVSQRPFAQGEQPEDCVDHTGHPLSEIVKKTP